MPRGFPGSVVFANQLQGDLSVAPNGLGGVQTWFARKTDPDGIPFLQHQDLLGLVEWSFGRSGWVEVAAPDSGKGVFAPARFGSQQQPPKQWRTR